MRRPSLLVVSLLAALTVGIGIGVALRSLPQPPAFDDWQPANRELPAGQLNVDAATDTQESLTAGSLKPVLQRDAALTADMTPSFDADTPVTVLFEALGPLARAGNPVAACELSHALTDCRRALNQPAEHQFHSVGGADERRFIEFEASRQEWLVRATRRCDGVGIDALREAPAFTMRAALAGHRPSMRDALAAPYATPAELLRDPQLAHAYRTQLWPQLHRAMLAGEHELGAIVLADLANQGPLSALSAFVPQRYQDARVAAELIPLYSPRPPESPLADTPQLSAEAQRWVDELFDGRFPDSSIAPRLSSEWPRKDSQCRTEGDWVQSSN